MSNGADRRNASVNHEDDDLRAIAARRGLRSGIAMPVQPPSKGPVSAHHGTGVTAKQPEKLVVITRPG